MSEIGYSDSSSRKLDDAHAATQATETKCPFPCFEALRALVRVDFFPFLNLKKRRKEKEDDKYTQSRKGGTRRHGGRERWERVAVNPRGTPKRKDGSFVRGGGREGKEGCGFCLREKRDKVTYTTWVTWDVCVSEIVAPSRIKSFLNAVLTSISAMQHSGGLCQCLIMSARKGTRNGERGRSVLLCIWRRRRTCRAMLTHLLSPT